MAKQIIQGPSVTVTKRFNTEEDKRIFLDFCALTGKSPKDIFSDFVTNAVAVMKSIKEKDPQFLDKVSRLRFVEIVSDQKNVNLTFKFLARQLDKRNPLLKAFVTFDNVLMLLNYVSFDDDAIQTFFNIMAEEYDKQN